MLKQISFQVLLFLFTQSVCGQNNITKEDSIASYFNDIKIAANANQQLWQKNLYGPVLLVNADNRQVYSNFPDSAGSLKQESKIYIGILPAKINIANTAMEWNGMSWAMIILPLPNDKYDRINLLAHELFHRAQPSLGFRFYDVENNHLDQKDGRIYLRLELEALQKAIEATTQKDMLNCLTDALTFRKYRYLLYPGADTTENTLELNEGLAEYTGFIVSGRNKKQSVLHFEQSIRNFLSNPTFVRSFAYQTIPVYGSLLHATKNYWNREITSKTNLINYFIKAFNLSLPQDLQKAVEHISAKYDGKAIMTEETARDEKRKKLVEEYENKFIVQPHFVLQFEQMNVSFDPRNIMPLDEKGSIYPNIRITDKWGILEVKNGALMSPNWDKISVTIPTKINCKNISGDGWTLLLNDGYSIIKDTTNGNCKLQKN